jgi:hypothetical protein
MKPIWNKINKGIGIVNLAIGIVLFYVIFDLTQKQIVHLENLTEQHGFPKVDKSFFELFLSNRILLTFGILASASGILILLRKKLGWILGYSFLIIASLILIQITIYGIRDVTTTIIEPEYWIQIYGGIGLLVSLTLLILLSIKPIRILNKINRNSWLWSFGIVLLIYLTPRIL